MAISNDTCLKLSISTQAYKVVSAHAHKISEWKNTSRLIDSRAPHLGGMNGYILNTTNNETVLTEITRVFDEDFKMKSKKDIYLST